MRDILFKAKRIDNGEWVEGWIVPTMSNTYPDGYRIIDVCGINYDELDYWEPNFISWKVDKNTICQYTGFNDNHGNKIWENDLIECKEFSNGYLIKHFLSQVEWDDGGTGFAFKDSKHGWAFMDSLTVYECQVIGNIYDNPELLKGGGEDE